MKKFKLYDQLFGWVAFLIAAVTYLMTIEPTASFWDCGEFISAAYKLDVGHPPGAPFFMLTARIFSMFASDPSHVAMMVNAMSALCSAFTILFLFWTITHLARKILVKSEDDFSTWKIVAILSAGMAGALAYTFSDTFWFSAVEGEVYAYSSFFTAIVFWAILKWEDAEVGYESRWIVLIAYLMGLSIGVHLLNLLAIPAIVLVYYFKKYKITTKNTLLALLTSVVILLAVLYGLIPGFVKVASWFELFFVNVIGCSFNTGVFVYLVVTVAVLIWAICETQREKKPLNIKIAFLLSVVLLGIPFLGNSVVLGLLIFAALCLFVFTYKKLNNKILNTIVLCMTMMLVGYSSYAMIVIRSAANPPMDQNSPEDVFSLQYYLNREQYGDRPLFYGAVYSAPEVLKQEGNYCVPIEKRGNAIWMQKEKTSKDEKDSYVISSYKHKGYEMDSRFEMLFPRMYSTAHADAYKAWGDIKGEKVSVDRCGDRKIITKPTFGENLYFFFNYQINYMYFRYFMWNFSGRQNDLQGSGEIDKGNWISGIGFIDDARLGDQSALPDVVKNNKGHNTYYMLPLLLGILGILWQLSKGKKGSQSFWITFALFFMTGIAIVIYLNQTPNQPRERDYAYAGSFYAFCIWIGLGVLMLVRWLNKLLPKTVSAIIASLLCLSVPALMAEQNWDDHDRSGRTTARDFGANYLNSCAPNAIIFSNGDNDTFPLWYNQEVEGERTDVRVCNLSYLQTDWYIDQMKRGAYKSAPLPISWERKDYVQNHLDVSRVMDHPQFNGTMPLSLALDIMRDPEFIDENGIGNVFASKLTVPIDKQQVLKTQTVSEKDSSKIVPTMEIKLGRSLDKTKLMMLEMINTNRWERPMYVAATVGDEYYPDIKRYMRLEGLAYRIVPIDGGYKSMVNTDAMFDNMMHKFKWGGIDNPNVYLEETNLRMCYTLRLMFSELVENLIQEGQKEKAKEALDYCMQVIPSTTVPHDYYSLLLANQYYALGDVALGDSIMDAVGDGCIQALKWNAQLSPSQRVAVSRSLSVKQNLGLLQNIYLSCSEAHSPLAEKYSNILQSYIKLMPK